MDSININYATNYENELFLSLIHTNNADKTDSLFTTYNEKILHNALKSFFVDNHSMHEVKLDFGPVADAIDTDGTVYEIQSRNLFKLKDKLRKYTENNIKTLVILPVVRNKRISWIDTKNKDKCVKSRISPKKLNIYEYFREIFSIKEYISTNISLMLFFIDATEYKLLNGWSADGKKGSTRYELIPEKFIGYTVINSREYFVSMLPQGLNEEFTSNDLCKILNLNSRKTWYVLSVFEHFGIIVRTEKKQGRAFVYKKLC